MSEEYGNNYVVLTDEDGNEVEFEHIDTLEHNGETYLAFIPAELAAEEEAEVVILKVEQDGEEEILATVDDDAEAEHIYDMFMERLEEMYDSDEDTEDKE